MLFSCVHEQNNEDNIIFHFQAIQKMGFGNPLTNVQNQQLFYNQHTSVTRYNLRTTYSLQQSKTI